MNRLSAPAPVASWQFDLYVEAEADGEATAEQLAVLEADRPGWRAALLRLVRDAEEHVATARSLRGEERDQVFADAQSDQQRLSAAWVRFAAMERGGERGDERDERDDETSPVPGVVQVQASWEPGRVVAWGGGPRAPAADGDEVMALLAAAGAPTSGWVRHAAISLPGGAVADAFAAPVGEVLGWLVAAGAGQVGDDVAPSVRWLGRVAIWAVELTARGAMVPLLRRRRRRSGTASSSTASFSVRWMPALVDAGRLDDVAREMPGSVVALDPSVDARALTRSALTGMVDAICRDSARRVEVPAPPPNVRTATDVTEAFLARLDGSAFDAPLRVAGELVARAEDWARSVTREHTALIVRLDPPERGDVWHLGVFASGAKGELVPIEHAIVNAGSDRRDLEDEMARLERMLPTLRRPGGTRRGQVILSQDEAWELMATTGPRLAVAGFDMRIPELSRHRPAPMLRVFADTSATSAVGASQLANVRWSALFGDVELTATDIARLAKEARPLIRSGGRWVAIDRADLDAAAAALAER
ncbi:MAG: SNF2 helicase-associated domain-containing protein, partial [Acidimicrobiia bacterium]